MESVSSVSMCLRNGCPTEDLPRIVLAIATRLATAKGGDSRLNAFFDSSIRLNTVL